MCRCFVRPGVFFISSVSTTTTTILRQTNAIRHHNQMATTDRYMITPLRRPPRARSLSLTAHPAVKCSALQVFFCCRVRCSETRRMNWLYAVGRLVDWHDDDENIKREAHGLFVRPNEQDDSRFVCLCGGSFSCGGSIDRRHLRHYGPHPFKHGKQTLTIYNS